MLSPKRGDDEKSCGRNIACDRDIDRGRERTLFAGGSGVEPEPGSLDVAAGPDIRRRSVSDRCWPDPARPHDNSHGQIPGRRGRSTPAVNLKSRRAAFLKTEFWYDYRKRLRE